MCYFLTFFQIVKGMLRACMTLVGGGGGSRCLQTHIKCIV